MPRWPSGPFSSHRTGCYGCKRQSPSDGGCGVHGYPCTHWGVDTFATTPEIYAPEDGVVVSVADGTSPPFTGYGPGVVLMKGMSGFYHLLAHLDLGSIRVTKGAKVAEGTLVGRYNAAYGHCHYEVRKQPTGPSETNTIDPEKWLAASKGGGGIGVLLVLGGLLAAGYFIARSNVFATRP
jgi:murein DD-endopeptidase MepM/ murein hydrolase activator NlpD